MQNFTFVGVCLLFSSLILSAAIVYHAKAMPAAPAVSAIGRYQFHPVNPARCDLGLGHHNRRG
jgi:hypothetical protein